MSAVTSQMTKYTFEDLLRLDDDGKSYELIDGHLEEVHVSNLSVLVSTDLTVRLSTFVKPLDLGIVLNGDAYYRCFRWKPKNARRADVSFIAKSRLPADYLTQSSYLIAPDLVVEVLSPNDLVYKVNSKINEYLRAGVKLIWEIDPEQRIVFIHRLGGGGSRLTEADELTGEDVLPGFSVRVADLFPPRAAAEEPVGAPEAPAE